MNADGLRSLQAPIKDGYRQHPETASVTLRAEGRIGEGLTCKVETGKALVEAGLHPATGGNGLSACSGDMLLEALVACAGVTLSAVATGLGIELRDATVRDILQRQLSLQQQATDATEEQIATLLRLTERYCVVYQTLAHPAKIDLLHRLISR